MNILKKLSFLMVFLITIPLLSDFIKIILSIMPSEMTYNFITIISIVSFSLMLSHIIVISLKIESPNKNRIFSDIFSTVVFSTSAFISSSAILYILQRKTIIFDQRNNFIELIAIFVAINFAAVITRLAVALMNDILKKTNKNIQLIIRYDFKNTQQVLFYIICIPLLMFTPQITTFLFTLSNNIVLSFFVFFLSFFTSMLLSIVVFYLFLKIKFK